MIDAKYARYVFALIMALFMSGLMSFIITVFNMGLVHNVLAIWLQAWLFAFCVAFPVIIIVTPFVQKVVAVIIKQNG
jgi:hypothetical protein